MRDNATLFQSSENRRDRRLCERSFREQCSLRGCYRALSTFPKDAHDRELEVSEMNIHKSSSASGREKVSSELLMRHHNDSQRCWVSDSLTKL